MPPSAHNDTAQPARDRHIRLHAAILAAGASERFHGIKALADVGDQTMLQRAHELVRSLDNVSATAVVGAHLEPLLEHLSLIRLPFVVNKQWQSGQRSSVQCALRALPDDADGLLIIALDQIALTSADLKALVAAFAEQPDHSVCAAYAGTRGVPAIFPRAHLARLDGDDADRGAQHLLLNDRQVVAIEMDNARLDIDTRAQLEQFNRERAMRIARN